MIELRELKDDEGVLRYGVGDTVEAHVIEAGARGILLSRALAKGSAKDGLYQMIYGSFGFGRFGDPYRSTDGLLEAGGVLLDRRDGGDWRTAYLTELCEVLENIRTGYRDQEVAKLLAMASEWR